MKLPTCDLIVELIGARHYYTTINGENHAAGQEFYKRETVEKLLSAIASTSSQQAISVDESSGQMVAIDELAILRMAESYSREVCHIRVYEFSEREFLQVARQIIATHQPASAQPVAVPDRIVEAVMLNITEAWRLGQAMYQYASKSSGKAMTKAAETQEEFDRVKSRVRAMLSAAQKPEGGE